MPDLGAPSSYLLLAPGVPVFSSDEREVGTLTKVLASPERDIFDAIVVKAVYGDRLIPAESVCEIFERGVELRIDAAAVASLDPPRPGLG